MNMIAKVGIVVGIVVAAFAIVPALKGPYNRFKNNANEALDAEYVVDNYKAEFISLHGKKQDIVKNISKFRVEQKVTAKKLAYAADKVAVAKTNLIEIGTADMEKFKRAKDAYELAKAEVANLTAMGNAYSNVLAKLEKTLSLIEVNMSKAKANVSALESKKVLVDSISAVNKTIENVNGVGDGNLGISIERLDDAMIRESIKLEALHDDSFPASDKASADAYLQSLK